MSNVSGSLAPTCNWWDGQTITLSILKPDGTTLASTTSTQCGNHVNAQLPAAGTYAVYVDVANARTGTLTLTLSQPVGGPITPIDDPLVVTLRPGQGVRKTFTGNVGDWISFAVSSVDPSLAPTCNWWDGQTITLSILNADGTTLASTTSTQCGNHVNAQLPAAGTYAVYVDVANARSGMLTVTLSTPAGGVIATNGDPVPITLRPGQGVRKTFTGTAGAWFDFVVTNVSSTLAPTCNWWDGQTITLALLKPDGTTLASTTSTQCGNWLDTRLPVDGTYTAYIDVANARAGTLTLILPADALGGATVDTPTHVAFSSGQFAHYTFDGEAGKTYSWAPANMTTTPAGGQLSIAITKPDGTPFTSGYNCVAFSATGGNCDISALPVTGTYTIAINPSGLFSASFDSWLTKTVDGGALTVGGAATTYATAKPGQNAVFTLAGTTGQTLRLNFANNTFAAGTLYVFKPDGSTLTSRAMSGVASGLLDLPALPVDGTYTVTVFVDGRATGSIDVWISTR